MESPQFVARMASLSRLEFDSSRLSMGDDPTDACDAQISDCRLDRRFDRGIRVALPCPAPWRRRRSCRRLARRRSPRGMAWRRMARRMLRRRLGPLRRLALLGLGLALLLGLPLSGRRCARYSRRCPGLSERSAGPISPGGRTGGSADVVLLRQSRRLLSLRHRLQQRLAARAGGASGDGAPISFQSEIMSRH